MCRKLGLFVVALLGLGIPLGAFAQGAVTIAEQRVVDIPDVEPLALSPDGRRLAVWNTAGEEPALCVLETATLAEERCATIPRSALAPESVVWSPDGTRLAATEESLRYGQDGDIWVVDVEAGTATDLTDDGTEKMLGAPVGTPIDLAPAWSPDGTEIAFSRTVKTGEDEEGDDIVSTALYRIPAAGGEPREVVKVADRGTVVYAGLRWLADGTLLYPVDMYTDEPENGVWTVAADGGTPRQVMTAESVHAEQVIVVDASNDGQSLVRYSRSVLALLDLATGEVVPLSRAIEGSKPIAAAFSPDGDVVLVADASVKLSGQLVLFHPTTSSHTVVGALEQLVGTPDYRSGLDWAANDLVFGPGPARTGVLVQLSVP